MGSISTLSGTYQGRPYYCAHYKRRLTVVLCKVGRRKFAKYGEFGATLRSFCATHHGNICSSQHYGSHRSHVGFTMRSLEGAVCSGGSICKWPSCRHSLYSTPICAICVGPIFVKISGIVGGHTLSAIRHKRSEFVATLLVKRGQIFEIRPPQKF